MNDKEIKDLLRELSEKAEKDGQIKSRTISITLNDKPKNKKTRRRAESDSSEEEETTLREEKRVEKQAESRAASRARRRVKDETPEEDEAEVKQRTHSDRTIRYEDGEPDFESDADDFRSSGEESEGGSVPGKALFGALSARLAGWKERRAEHEEKDPGDPEAAAEFAGLASQETEEEDLPEKFTQEIRTGGGDDEEEWLSEFADDKEEVRDEEEVLSGEGEILPVEEDNLFEEEQQLPGEEPEPDSEPAVEGSEEEQEDALFEEEHEVASPAEQSGEIPVKKKTPFKLPFHADPKILAIAAAAVILLIVIIIAAAGSLGGHKKSENVTVDQGLTLTVEKEPSKWAYTGNVTLGIRTKSPIQTITVNGENIAFTGKNKTKVTFQTSDHLLDVMVVSEDSVRKGQVTLEKIDSTAPELEISVSGGMVSMTAADDVSGIEGIYYGIVQGLTTVPIYTKYNEPFKPEEQKIYYCTARDIAGNFSKPVITDLTQATGISLDTENMNLFPGETRQLQINPEPAGAFLSGLRIVNTDSSVISIDENGLITALAEGTSLVTISADGTQTVNCAVTVRTEAAATVSFTGDCTLGDDETFSSENSLGSFYSAYGPDYFFANVKDIFAADDYTFVNLECPFTDQGERFQKEYAFRGKPEYVNILTDGNVDGVTLANNHSADYGDISLTDTEKYLDEAGIDYALERDYILKNINGIQIAFIGVHALFDGMTCLDRVEETINDARSAGAEIVIVAFHWGDELSTTPAEVQVDLGHAAIDMGADLVVGHHPHVLQGIEIYKDKYIVYSLANFCFGGNTNPRELDTMIFQMTFTLSETGEAQGSSINIIPCSSSSAEGWNNYQPTPAQGEEAQRIIDKINERSEPFGFSYDYQP